MTFLIDVPCPICGEPQELKLGFPDTHITSKRCENCTRIWEMGMRADQAKPMSETEGGMFHLGIARGWNKCLKEIKGQ